MDQRDGLKHGDLTYRIIGCAQRVHSTLGPGFPETVYHKALTHELMRKGISFSSEKAFSVHYDGVRCGEFRADLVVSESVILELKALSSLHGEHIAQVLSYLKASGLSVGLLINFGCKSLDTKRVVL